MIRLTIKTLDSKNHTFQVPDECTVKELKEQIAGSVAVPADSQRLIYCGRVLLDDKKLSDYDVDGKVIHLVERAPPSSGPSTSAGGSSSADGRAASTAGGSNQSGGRSRLRAVSTGGRDAMYLGAMAFPADLIDTQGISLPQPRFLQITPDFDLFLQSRLAVARSMMRRLRTILIGLEDSSSTDQSSSETPNDQEPKPEESGSGGSSNSSSRPSEQRASSAPKSNDSAEMPQSSAPPQSSSGSDLPPPSGGRLVDGVSFGPGDLNNISHEVEITTDGGTNEERRSATNEGDIPLNSGLRLPATVAVLLLLNQLQDVSRRLEPFLVQYQNLIANEPPVTNVLEAQRIFNQVSETMHLLAHLYHSLSDIMCDFSQTAPRQLHCRPIIIQHSAVVQAGIPIQTLNLNSSSSRSNGAQAENAAAAAAAPPPPPPPPSDEQATSGSNNNNNNNANNNNNSQPQATNSRDAAGGGASNLENMMDVFMEVGGSLTIGPLDASSPSSVNLESTATFSGSPQSSFPWHHPSEFLQNLIHRLSGDLGGNNNNNSTNNNNSQSVQSGSSGRAAREAPAASGSTETDTPRPTTRSISGGTFLARPTIRPMQISGNGGGVQTVDFFDPFLPCSSHHIRRVRSSNSNGVQSGNQESNQGTTAGGASDPGRAAGWRSDSATLSHIPADIYPITGSSLTLEISTGPGATRSSSRTNTVRLLTREPPFPSMRRTTVAQLLENTPNYTPGQSIIMDFLMSVGQSVTFHDIHSNSVNLLRNLRPTLRMFISRNLQVEVNSDASIEEAVERVTSEIRPFFESMDFQEGINIREDINIAATITKVFAHFMPLLIKEVMEAEDIYYVTSVLTIFNHFIRCVLNILLHSSHVNVVLDNLVTVFARLMVRRAPEFCRGWLSMEVASLLKRQSRGLDGRLDPLHTSFIVLTLADPPQPAQLEASQLPSRPPQPMETEPIRGLSAADCLIEHAELLRDHVDNLLGTDATISEDVLAPEQWHHAVPPDWVPIITRDKREQRRAAPQGPLSDTYVSGMPSKRRKLISEAKPDGTISKVIADSMNVALNAAGIDANEAEGVAERAGSDSVLRAAYKDQVKTTVESTLRNHPDYHPDKYPNSAKYFSPPHRE